MKIFSYIFETLLFILIIGLVLLSILLFSVKKKDNKGLLIGIGKCIISLLGIAGVYACFGRLQDYRYLVAAMVIFLIYIIIVCASKLFVIKFVSKYHFSNLLKKIIADMKDYFDSELNIFDKISSILVFLLTPDYVLSKISKNAIIIDPNNEEYNRYNRTFLIRDFNLVNLLFIIVIGIISYFVFYYSDSLPLLLGLKAFIIYRVISRTIEIIISLIKHVSSDINRSTLEFLDRIILMGLSIVEISIMITVAYLSYRYDLKDALAGGLSGVVGNVTNPNGYYGLTVLSTLSYVSVLALIISGFATYFKIKRNVLKISEVKLVVIDKKIDKVIDMLNMSKLESHKEIFTITKEVSSDLAFIIFYDNNYYGYMNILNKEVVNKNNCVNDNFSINGNKEVVITFNKNSKDITIK